RAYSFYRGCCGGYNVVMPKEWRACRMLNVSEDIQFQIECFSTELVEMLMQKYGWDMKKALDELYSSETYKRLCNPDCGLYYEGSVYVFSYLENEIETGVVC
ncbi:hypothetical protein, partial [Leyella stercorea]|uniref:hypothetical protein n=2 Tax=Prevotellaceae TaxID=171552 RepID=UPI00242BBE9E